MTRQRRCRIYHERPAWRGKNVPRASANVVITGRSGSTGRRHAASALGLNAAHPLTPSRTSRAPLVYDVYDAISTHSARRTVPPPGRVETALVAYEAAIARTENAVQRTFLRRQRD